RRRAVVDRGRRGQGGRHAQGGGRRTRLRPLLDPVHDRLQRPGGRGRGVQRRLHAPVRYRPRPGRDGRAHRLVRGPAAVGAGDDPTGPAAAAAQPVARCAVTAAAVAAGGLFGLGAFLLVYPLLPATPVVDRALRRLHPDLVVTGRSGLAAADRWRWLWRPPHRELALIGRTPSQYAVSVGGSALIGLAAPLALATLVPLLGWRVPVV